MDETQNQKDVQTTNINKTESQENSINERNNNAVSQFQELQQTNDPINERHSWYKNFMSKILSFFKRGSQ